MGFFDRMRGQEPIRDMGGGQIEVSAVMLNGGGTVEVVGEASYQAELDRICGGRCEDGHNREVMAALVPEPSNPYDENAVAIQVDGMRVGYLSRADALAYRPVVAQLSKRNTVGACQAVIRGGWDRGGGDTGNYGVSLSLAGPAQAHPA
jgi:hypothetical protein